MLRHFLAELFCAPESELGACVEDVVDMQAGILDYRKLLQHPRVRLNLCFAWLFRDVFGTYPSKLHLWEYAQAHLLAQPPTLASLGQAMCTCHGLLRVLKHAHELVAASPDRAARFHSFLSSLNAHPDFGKDFLLGLIADRHDSDLTDPSNHVAGKSLYARYCALLSSASAPTLQVPLSDTDEFQEGLQQPAAHNTKAEPEAADADIVRSRYAEHARRIEAEGLLDTCIVTGCPVHERDPQTISKRDHIALTFVDALRYAVHANPYLLRVLFQRPKGVVCIMPEVGTHLATHIAKELARTHHGKERLVLTATQAPLLEHVWNTQHASVLLQRCLPTTFDFRGDNAAEAQRPALFVDNQLLRTLHIAPYVHCSIVARAVQDRLSGAIAYTRHLYRLHAAALMQLEHGVSLANASDSDNSRASTGASANAVVLIDNRPNPLSVMSCYVTLANLRPNTWSLVVYTSEAAAAYYREVLPSGTHVRSDAVRLLGMDLDAFSIEDYNAILKGEVLWADLHDSLGVRNALIIQDDGMVVRPGLEDEFLDKYDYVGAPWALDWPTNAQLASLANPQMVGNGGVSLRSVAHHLRVARECPPAQKLRLFNEGLQPVPEDVFFAGQLYASQARIPTHEQAQRFGSEEVLNPDSLAFHKIWAYHPSEAVDAFFDRVADEGAVDV